MIFLKWFNRLKNLLFSEDNENLDKLDNEVNESDFETEKNISNEKPTFRFPIITDAEIYGWEEDGVTQEEESPKKTTDYEEDDFEPIPFYQNERWSKNDAKSNIYRANSNNENSNSLEIERELVKSKDTKDIGFVEPAESAQKRATKKFNPTQVPSPIFGFTNREKLADLSSRAESTMLPKPKKLIEKEEVFTLHDPEEITQANRENHVNAESTELNSFQQQSEIVTKDEIVIVEQEKVIEIPTEVIPEQSFDNESEKEIEYHDEPEPEPEPEPDNEWKQPLNKEEKKQERVVPFNVLMLKKDKERLNTVNKVADIQATLENKKKALNTEKIKEKVIKEEVIDIEQDAVDILEEEPHYRLPSLEQLIPPELHEEDTEWLTDQSQKLEESLSHFGIQASVIDAVQGPTVTRFELTVGQGTKVSRVRNLTDDLKLTLAAKEIRIQAPIPGKSSIGIEIPNRKTRPVRISEVIGTASFMASDSPLEAVLGLGLTGEPVTLDLRKMPHGLIAGATGSGKSVCINSILVSLLYKASPTDLKMMLIDPKMVELAPFNGIPHLISPVITDVKAATAALKWAVGEMERRYELLAHTGVRDIERYNKVVIENRKFSLKMPYLLIVIDELSDLMMMSPADVEVSIIRIAQKARACGIHLIIATQRPSVDVITGTIKANIPTRIAFSVSSQVDSRTIIDTVGAERLLGKGDMLYLGNGQSSSVRLQGTFVTDDEIERIVDHVRLEASPNYLFGQEELLKSAVEEEETDPLFEEAVKFIFKQDSASTSLLQRNFSIGYNRAAKLMDRIEKHGFISEQRGSRARDVLLTQTDIENLSEPVI